MPYVDPGAGSMLIQVLAAGVIALLVAVAKVRDKVRLIVRRLFKR